METKEIDIKLLQTNNGQVDGLPKNPRQIKDGRYELLKKSITDAPEMLKLRELLVYPIDGGKFVVIGGNMRLRACKELGYKTLPCKVLDVATPPLKLREYAIKDNESFGEYDWDILANEWDAPEVMSWGVELPLWDDAEEKADEETQEVKDDNFDEANETITPRAQKGDIWQLGDHRLMCGDSTDAGSVALLMGGEKADLVFTSPPYNASASSICPGKKFGDRRPDVKMYGENVTDAKTSDEYVDFAKSVLKNCLDFTDGMVYWNVNYNSNSKFEYIAQIVDYLDMLVDQVCWKKHLTITNTGGGYTRIWEPIYVFSTLKTPLRLREVAMNFWEVDNVGATVGDHHACFPVALPLKALDLYGDQIKTVLEPFCGAGSTLIACEQRGVACRGMELEPRFCDVIVKRWQDFAGQEATLEEDGRTFAQVKEERGG